MKNVCSLRKHWSVSWSRKGCRCPRRCVSSVRRCRPSSQKRAPTCPSRRCRPAAVSPSWVRPQPLFPSPRESPTVVSIQASPLLRCCGADATGQKQKRKPWQLCCQGTDFCHSFSWGFAPEIWVPSNGLRWHDSLSSAYVKNGKSIRLFCRLKRAPLWFENCRVSTETRASNTYLWYRVFFEVELAVINVYKYLIPWAYEIIWNSDFYILCYRSCPVNIRYRAWIINHSKAKRDFKLWFHLDHKETWSQYYVQPRHGWWMIYTCRP